MDCLPYSLYVFKYSKFLPLESSSHDDPYLVYVHYTLLNYILIFQYSISRSSFSFSSNQFWESKILTPLILGCYNPGCKKLPVCRKPSLWPTGSLDSELWGLCNTTVIGVIIFSMYYFVWVDEIPLMSVTIKT